MKLFYRQSGEGPPLIILLLTGNGSRQSVENLLLNNAGQMQAALADQSIAIFELR